MKRTILFSVAAVFLMASYANATTVWNPFANGHGPAPATAPFGDPNNWTAGTPGAPDTKAVFNVPNAADAEVAGAFSGFKLVQGDGADGGVIRIKAGGSITTENSWSAIGWNDTAHTIVEAGGVLNFGQHAWIGNNVGSVGTLDISGTGSVAAMLGAGWSGGTGYVNVLDGGILDLFQLHGDGISSLNNGSLLDISGSGMVTLPGNYTGVINAYVGNNAIAGNGVVGNIKITVTGTPSVDEMTTITAIPEPSSLLLCALGLGGILLGKRR